MVGRVPFSLHRFILKSRSDLRKLQCRPKRSVATHYIRSIYRLADLFIQAFTKRPESMVNADVAEGEVSDLGRNGSDAPATTPDNTLKRSLKVGRCNVVPQCYTS